MRRRALANLHPRDAQRDCSKEVFSLPEFGEWFARMMPLVESGRREFYHIEE